jgi:cytochrome d ubiquinol oxidase subunit II
MDLNTLWFLLIGVLFTGFFVLEGFDYGVGILLPFLGKTDGERRRIINTIGPVWDGNEVWILTGGGAIFAAFPHWYATLFSGFYLALFLMLVALIVRGVGFEFRSKDSHPAWRTTWDWMIFFGSAVPALLWGVALANLLKGTPIDATKTFTGGFFDLLSPYTFLAGLATFSLFVTHGAIFLNPKSTDPIRPGGGRHEEGRAGGNGASAPLRGGYLRLTDVYARLGVNPARALLALGALLARGPHPPEKMGWAFTMTTLTILFTVATLFVSLYPRVMVSSLRPEWSLTIYNASSTPYTLKVMSIVAGIFVPIVLAYQAWTYWVFRHRITAETKLEY